MEIKLVDRDEKIIKIRAKTVKPVLSNFPIISIGLVNIWSTTISFWFKKTSTPTTIDVAKNENKIIFRKRLRFPNFRSLSVLTYLEKSPKFNNTIEKYEKIVPVKTTKGKTLDFEKKFPSVVFDLRDWKICVWFSEVKIKKKLTNLNKQRWLKTVKIFD